MTRSLNSIEVLDANIKGDVKGLPDWSSHFGSQTFNQSAVEAVLPTVLDRYSGAHISVVSLCGGVAFYERAITQSLHENGKVVDLTVYDLQPGSLKQIPEEDYPISAVEADITEPLAYSGDSPTLFASRAFEHYLTSESLKKALGNLVNTSMLPGELYLPKISSGSRGALDTLAAATTALAAKSERFMTLEQYKAEIGAVNEAGARNTYQELDVVYAETQTGRGAAAQARRYLNSSFATLHGLNESAQREVADIERYKAEVGVHVRSGMVTRQEGIDLIDNYIANTIVFQEFRKIYLDAVLPVARKADGQRGITIVEDSGKVYDVQVDIEYPIIILEKVAHARC